jgi:hypothetical protein
MDDFDSLRICPECDCRLCFEAGADYLTPSKWLVVIQCPNCWHSWSRIVGSAELELLEYTLDEDIRIIADELRHLEYANALAEAYQWEAEIARFVAALEAGAILPMDF